MNAIQIIELLRLRHPAPEWATFSELADGTGMRFSGRIDFFAMHLWPSKRYLKIAYEIKIARGDFMRELDNPRKRRSAEQYADECYFVAPAGLLRADEMPEGWGLLECDRGGLKTKKRAMQKEVQALPLDFVAALARRSTEPPSPLPEIFWRYAGQELTFEQLLLAAKENLEAYASQKKIEGVSQYKDTDEYKRLKALESIVGQETEWGFTYNPERLREWFHQHRKGGLDTKTRAFLNRLKDDLNRLIPD